jgi:hypothetical protein
MGWRRLGRYALWYGVVAGGSATGSAALVASWRPEVGVPLLGALAVGGLFGAGATLGGGTFNAAAFGDDDVVHTGGDVHTGGTVGPELLGIPTPDRLGAGLVALGASVWAWLLAAVVVETGLV